METLTPPIWVYIKKEIIDQVDDVKNQIYEMINDNTNPNETILIIGVGNTIGVSQ